MSVGVTKFSDANEERIGLYTPEQMRRRDATVWTTVQAILAPLQFLVFLVSLALVVRYLMTGHGEMLATVSIVVKTMILYAIMITGSIWEKEVFGKYLFAEAFFWEDVVSMLVMVLHTAYLVALLFDLGTTTQQMWLALAAYASYVINAVQFVWKLRCARLQAAAAKAGEPAKPAATRNNDDGQLVPAPRPAGAH